jgi:hypothetical protein
MDGCSHIDIYHTQGVRQAGLWRRNVGASAVCLLELMSDQGGRLEVERRFVLELHVAPGEATVHRIELLIDFEFSTYAQHLPPLQALPAIFDRVLAEHGSYLLEPLVHGQRHAVHFDTGGR